MDKSDFKISTRIRPNSIGAMTVAGVTGLSIVNQVMASPMAKMGAVVGMAAAAGIVAQIIAGVVNAENADGPDANGKVSTLIRPNTIGGFTAVGMIGDGAVSSVLPQISPEHMWAGLGAIFATGAVAHIVAGVIGAGNND